MTIQILGIDNVLFGVGDFGEARHFYEEQLELPVKFAVESLGIVGYHLGPETPGLFLRVEPIPPTPPRETPRLWLEVPDARAAALQLAEQEITVLHEPFEVATGWVVEFADPWGNVIGLTDYVKDPTKARSGINHM